MRSACFIPLIALSACNPSSDYHGMEPAAYHATFSKTNRVETLYESHALYFTAQGTLTNASKESFKLFLNDIPPDSVERATIRMRSANTARSLYITRLMRNQGFAKRVVDSVADRHVRPNVGYVDVTFTQVVSPDCPDWRKSSVTNYSNTLHSNMHCAVLTNVGMTIANPRDLEYNPGRVVADPERNAQVIGQYRSGTVTAAPPATATGSASTATTPAQ